VASVVVVAPRYDEDTRITSGWSEELVAALQGFGVPAIHLLASEATSENLLKAVPSVDLFVFFGHGDTDRLVGQPSSGLQGDGPTLVDISTIRVLEGKPVYAIACNALLELGKQYANEFPSGCFVGYQDEFCLPPISHAHFGMVVNRGALMMATTLDGPLVVAELIADWTDLRKEFESGSLNSEPDWFIASFAAYQNAACVGRRP
jgi:hypothetical protein